MLLGPLLSLLPERWRKALPFYQSVHWRSAAVLSGLAESVIALGGLMYWYSYSVTTWVSRGLDNTLSKSAPTAITDHEIGFAALLIWATHPLAGVPGRAVLIYSPDEVPVTASHREDSLLPAFRHSL